MTIRPTQRAITDLAQYQTETQVIAINRNALSERITLLDRSDITIWQRFLRIFCCGKLAHYEFRLQEVSKYLCRYDWMPLARAEEATEQGQAYRKVCQLAGKALLYKKERRFWECVSQRTTSVITINQHFLSRFYFNLNGTEYHDIFTRPYFLYYNPVCQVRHIVAHLQCSFPRSVIAVQNTQGITLPPEHSVSTEDALQALSTRIHQKFLLLSA